MKPNAVCPPLVVLLLAGLVAPSWAQSRKTTLEEALAEGREPAVSVPFLTAPEDLREPLRQLAAQHQLLVVQGNRMSHLLSGGSHKGRAVEVLKQHLQQPDVAVLGLGDSPNDLPMLEAVDQAVVVPGAQGPHPVFQDAIASGRFQLAQAPHGEGWAIAVNQWLNS